MTHAELERQVVNLKNAIAFLTADVERSQRRLALLKATLSQHRHDWTRDITGKPATYTPETHTHPKASSTHAHTYQDHRFTLTDDDVSRNTDVPREP